MSMLTFSSVHLICSIRMLVGARQCNRRMMLPWLLLEGIITSCLVVFFICFTFLTFFIDLYIVVIFPVLAGLILGLRLCSFRIVFQHFKLLKRMKDGSSSTRNLSLSSYDSL